MIKLNRKPCPHPNLLVGNYKNPLNKEALRQSTFGKCMYCESKIDHIDYGDVEHIKPKSTYPTLEFDWDNLGFACVKCNRDSKKDLYDPNFIDPFLRDPQQFFLILGGLFSSKKSNVSGQITLDILKINREELFLKRYYSLLSFIELVSRFNTCTNMNQKEAIKALIEDELSDDKEYVATKRSYWEYSQL